MNSLYEALSLLKGTAESELTDQGAEYISLTGTNHSVCVKTNNNVLLVDGSQTADSIIVLTIFSPYQQHCRKAYQIFNVYRALS